MEKTKNERFNRRIFVKNAFCVILVINVLRKLEILESIKGEVGDFGSQRFSNSQSVSR